MTIKDIEKIISEFGHLPKFLSEPTYLEICNYPKRRFEEICSRLLCFYLAPKNEHGFRDLFLKSLFEVLTNESIPYSEDLVSVTSEENAEGKRLDILIYSTNFVIGIENKVYASIYNPLETYKNRIDLYKSENVFRLVLSLRKITNRQDLQKLKDNGFTSLTYFYFFSIVRKNIGQYIHQANPKYLIFLMDFIQTLETMSGENILNEKLENFFYDNSDTINNLVKLYTKYNERVLDVQIQRIAELKEAISEQTQDFDWWIWSRWDLGYTNSKTLKPKIGIECSYTATKGKPLGIFTIYLTTWNLIDWAYYEKIILNRYPSNLLDKRDGRAYLRMDTIEDDNEDQIMEKLSEYHSFLRILTT